MNKPFMNSNNLYTGGDEYFLKFENGKHKIKKLVYDGLETVFSGHYEECIEQMEQIIIDNADYDLNL